MLSDERIAGITARVQAATEGPWVDDVDEHGILRVHLGQVDALYFGDMETTTMLDHDNAAFVANARQDIPDLLAERAELLSQIDELESTLSEAMADGSDDGERFRQVGPRVPR